MAYRFLLEVPETLAESASLSVERVDDAQVVQLGLRFARGGQHRLTALHEALAGGGEADAPGGTVQQRDAHVAFQRTQLLAHGGGGRLQLPGRRDQAALFDHGGQHGHAAELIQHRGIV